MSGLAIFFYVILGIIVFVIALNFNKIGPLFQKMGVFYDEVRFEMAKVTWPSRDEVINSTMLVFLTTIALTFMIWVVDFVLGRAVNILF